MPLVLWSFANITNPQFEDTKAYVEKDSVDRKKYLELAFTQVIMDLQVQITEMHSKVLMGDTKLQEKIQKKQERTNELILKNKLVWKAWN